jgi:hypothetical protein
MYDVLLTVSDHPHELFHHHERHHIMREHVFTTKTYEVWDTDLMVSDGSRKTFLPVGVTVHEWHHLGVTEVEVSGPIIRSNGRVSRRRNGLAYFRLERNEMPTGWPTWLVQVITGVSEDSASKLTASNSEV